MAQQVRIFLSPKSAMQSGRANTRRWLMDYLNTTPRQPDPLMGWIGGSDTVSQLRLTFATKAEAIAFAERNGLIAIVEPEEPRQIRPKSYADNFRFGRPENWTH